MRHQTYFNDFLKGKKIICQVFFLSTDHDVSPRISLPFFCGAIFPFCTTATLPPASPTARNGNKNLISCSCAFLVFLRRVFFFCFVLFATHSAPMTRTKRRPSGSFRMCGRFTKVARETKTRKSFQTPRGGQFECVVGLVFAGRFDRIFHHFASSLDAFHENVVTADHQSK